MFKRFVWSILLLTLGLSTRAHADEEPVFAEPWFLTESEPSTWAKQPRQVRPDKLEGWRTYQESQVPPGINKTIWLRNTLPEIKNAQQVLYFANGLEDLAVYIDGKRVYRYGDFSKTWHTVSPQRWHVIPLKPEYSGKQVLIRTHYALSYVVRTLYPKIRVHSEVLSEHTSRSLPTIVMAGVFLVLGIGALSMAAMRRMVDLFLYFGIMAISVACWVLFNQDSLIKPYTGLPPRSWAYFDLIGIYLSAACLISFLSGVAQSKSKVINAVRHLNWGMAAFVALASASGQIHAWYLLPLLHIAVFPSLLVLIPLIVWSAFHKNADARILMIGSVAMGLSAIHDILRYSANFKTPFTTLIPAGGAVILGVMVVILIRRYQAERDEAFRTQAKLLKDIQRLNSELQKHVEQVEALVDEKTREIVSILGHIQQGIFMITGPDLSVHEEYSSHLETLLDTTEIARQSFQTCFLDRCQLSNDQRSKLLATLNASLDDDVENFDVNAANLPSEVQLNARSETKIIELTWSPILNDQGLVDKVLVTARDVTRIRQLQSATQKIQEEIRVIHAILSAKPERLMRFIDHGLSHLSDASTLAEGNLVSLFRSLHTIKGNARSFKLDELASLVHDAEQTVVSLQKQEKAASRTILASQIQVVHARLKGYRDLLIQIIPSEQLGSQVSLDRSLVEAVFKQISFLSLSERLQRLEALLLPKTFSEARETFHMLAAGLETLARDLGKQPPQLEVRSEGIYFTQDAVVLLGDCFGHLFRNSIDHGLEDPEHRRAVGKSPQGKLLIHCQVEGDRLIIDFQDDGRGLHEPTIRRRALDKGLWQGPGELTPAAMDAILFAPGFTTKQEVSLVSGRGVGLDAVRGALEEKGGSIRLECLSRDEYQGTWTFRFTLSLPTSLYLYLQEPLTTRVAS